jgi:protease-4
MSFFSLLMGGAPGRRPLATGPSVAVIFAVGPILSGDGEGFGLGEEAVNARSFVKMVRKAADDENVKAIVLRVDSPGGSAQACDEIWRELRLADAKKPVVASLSDVAASGGYYIAAGSRAIYADPGSLTGSIGVFGGKLVLTGLFQKLGLNVVAIERGGRAGIESVFQEFTPDERRKVEELIGDTYRTFLLRVATTRPHMTVADVDRVARGRVWTANQAHENGLVDSLGGLNDAIEAAKRAAGIPTAQAVDILYLPQPRSLLEHILLGSEEKARLGELWSAAALPGPLGQVRPYLMALMAMKDEVSICMLPAVLTVR